ncbi:hypothetical protein IB227_02325 [Stenotrophomonas sp. STM01]|uniref:hypothetical protein n=1 Tax=Stenotrophomonas sp. STM01 TaxID=2769278 RepID=UPI00177B2DF2|nr:hypothetical protein [Stenotrophomonas sp. STM01]MBD9534686.1 hypothetical protein [Stenotrophomonas sp. STM01]
MHATIDSTALAAALKTSVAPTNTPHPTLTHALVRAEGESLVLETTDSATYMRHTLPCKVHTPGEALLRVALLRPIAAAPGDVVLRDDGRVSRGRSNFRVPASDVSAWPAEREEAWQRVDIDPAVLAAAIKSAGYAADDDTMYTNVRGLHIHGGLVWGSDGISLSYADIGYTGPSITIPDGQVPRVVPMLQEGAVIEIGNVNHDVAGVLRVTAGEQQLSVRLLGAKATDIRAIAKGASYCAEHSAIKRDVLLAAVKRFLPFASILGESKAKGLPVMILAMVGGELYLADRAEENREVISEAVLTAGPDFRAALDPRRLVSALMAVDSNVIALHAPQKGKGMASWMLYEDQGDAESTAHLISQMNI